MAADSRGWSRCREGRLALWLPSLLVAALCAWPSLALARVEVSFHSFNGSVLFGRYPHTFVVFEGSLEATGETVNENVGFSAEVAGPGVLFGPAKHTMTHEDAAYVESTNRHFTVPVSDETYHRMKAEIARWRDAPGKFYDLERRNCIHFVGRMAEMAGLKVSFPDKLLRKPRAWLKHIAALNPQLGDRAPD